MVGCPIFVRLRNLRLSLEDIPSRTFVLGILARLQPVISQGGIERTRRGVDFLAATLHAGGRSSRRAWLITSRRASGDRRRRRRTRSSVIEKKHDHGERHQREGDE